MPVTVATLELPVVTTETSPVMAPRFAGLPGAPVRSVTTKGPQFVLQLIVLANCGAGLD